MLLFFFCFLTANYFPWKHTKKKIQKWNMLDWRRKHIYIVVFFVGCSSHPPPQELHCAIEHTCQFDIGFNFDLGFKLNKRNANSFVPYTFFPLLIFVIYTFFRWFISILPDEFDAHFGWKCFEWISFQIIQQKNIFNSNSAMLLFGIWKVD